MRASVRQIPEACLFFGCLGLLSACDFTGTSADACARVAANLEENYVIDGDVVGVAFDKIEKFAAVSRCRSALENEGKPETKYHLARALISSDVTQDELQEAERLLTEAVKEGYSKANIGLGYIQYTFEPQNGSKAAEFYLKAFEAGMATGKLGAASALLFLEDTKSRRAEGLTLMTEAAQNDASLYLTLANYYRNSSKEKSQWEKAEQALLIAKGNDVKQADIELANIYFDEQSPIRDLRKARNVAKLAAESGNSAGYEVWLKSYYFSSSPNYKKAISIALDGANAGNVYSAYVAGHMYFHAQGTEKNTFEAERYLKFASENGSSSATKLLQEEVTARANRLRALPSKSAQSCVTQKVSSYDKNIIDYRNGCAEWLNAIICNRHVATELWSLFDGKDREGCRRKQVSSYQYIDNFYGADQNSSLARKAIANTNVRIGVCYHPLIPVLNGNTVTCKEN